MDKKLVIFGGGGFVGGNMTEIARQKGWKVYIADSFFRPGLEGVEWRTVDIADTAVVERLIAEIRPDAVVNVAAVADIDKAEHEKELAWKVNVEGAANIAAGCAKNGVRNIFFSSDAVFDGEGGNYTEEHPVNPVNYYGRTKAEAEKVVLKADPKAAVIRISLVIGFPVTGGNSFFAGLEKKLSEGQDILCPAEEIRTPVDVLTLSECVLELAENNYSDVLHIGATDSINRLELTRKAAVRMGFDESRVKVKPLQDMTGGRLPRHKNGIICVRKAQTVLKTALLSVEESIERAFRDRL